MQFTRTESVNHDSHCIICSLPIIHLVLQLASLLLGIYRVQIILYLVALATDNRKSTCLIPFTGCFCGDDRPPEVLFTLTNITGVHHLPTGYPNYFGEMESCLSSRRRRMTNQTGNPAVSGPEKIEVQNSVQGMKKGSEVVNKQANKNPSELAGSQGAKVFSTATNGKAQRPAQQLRRFYKGDQINPAAVLGYAYLMTTLPPTDAANDDHLAKLEQIEQAKETEDGLSKSIRSLLRKRDLLRKGGRHD
ncbi:MULTISPECIES: hypothetical protein [Aeromonas]